MTITHKQTVLAALLISAMAITSAQAQTMPTPPAITTPDKVETSIGTLEYRDGAPNAATVQKVRGLETLAARK